ncbi:unnamed protein product [Caretta caretta]
MKSSMDTSPRHGGLVNPTPRLAAFAVVIGRLCIALIPSWPVLSLWRFEDWKMELSTVPRSSTLEWNVRIPALSSPEEHHSVEGNIENIRSVGKRHLPWKPCPSIQVLKARVGRDDANRPKGESTITKDPPVCSKKGDFSFQRATPQHGGKLDSSARDWPFLQSLAKHTMLTEEPGRTAPEWHHAQTQVCSSMDMHLEAHRTRKTAFLCILACSDETSPWSHPFVGTKDFYPPWRWQYLLFFMFPNCATFWLAATEGLEHETWLEKTITPSQWRLKFYCHVYK